MLLRATVFLCGAVVMSLEMLAFRKLNPAFGSGLPVWGALIGSFIGALSLGYWLGGLAADRWQTTVGIGIIILASGLVTVALVPATDPVMDYISELNDMQALVSGQWLKPVIASTLIYSIPVILLGAVSPYAIRLASRDLASLGHKVGGFYAISSVGSIFGTFLTAFYLIEKLGVSRIILADGLVLVALSLPLLVRGGSSRRARTQKE